MRKLSLTVIGMYLTMVQAFSQTPPPDSTGYKPKKLKLDEVNLVSSYYSQTADKSAVMGGRPDTKGIGNVTDMANGIDITFIGWDKHKRKNSLTLGLAVDYHTAASQAFVDSNGRARNNGTRIYPTLSWLRENEQKGTSVGLGAYYSAENNYYHSVGLNMSASKKTTNKGEFTVKLVSFFDRINMIYPTEFIPVDSIKGGLTADSIVYVTSASGRTEAVNYTTGQVVGKSSHVQVPTKARNTYTASFAFSQVINQRMQASLEADFVYQTGYLGLPFHRVFFNNGKDTIEHLPDQRFKLPLGFRLNYFLGDKIILRSYYRFYIDSWGLTSHTLNLEVPVKITPFISVSPFYRFYTQTAARYFAGYAQHLPTDQYFSSNYALAAFQSHSFGVGMRVAPPSGIFTPHMKTLEIRYGHYIQTTNLNANVISLNIQLK